MSLKKILLGAAFTALSAGLLPAEVVRIEVTEKSPVLNGKPFGKTGPYDRLVGKVYFEVDPENDANRRVSDIDYASVNSRGRVEYSADLYLLVPRDPGTPPKATAPSSTRSSTAAAKAPSTSSTSPRAPTIRVKRNTSATASCSTKASPSPGWAGNTMSRPSPD